MCIPCKSGSLAGLIARSSEFVWVSAPMFVQSALESVQLVKSKHPPRRYQSNFDYKIRHYKTNSLNNYSIN